MAVTQKIFGLLALALLSQVALALPERRAPQVVSLSLENTCFTRTETVPYTGHMYCPMETACKYVTSTCKTPAKTATETVSVSCKDAQCPTTPTVTVTASGKCAGCATDCGTKTVTKTATYGCPITATPTSDSLATTITIGTLSIGF